MAEPVQNAGVGDNAEAGGQQTAEQPAPTGGMDTQKLQEQLAEQKKIQAGLDRRLAQLQEQLRLLTEENEGLKKQLDEAHKTTADSAAELEQLRSRVPELESELGTLKEQLGKHNAESQRAKLVATEFPMLAPLLETGGLPPFESEEQFRESAQKIVNALNLSAQTQYQAQMAGVRPPASPPSNATGDLESLKADMSRAWRAGDMEKFRQLQDLWYQAVEENLPRIPQS